MHCSELDTLINLLRTCIHAYSITKQLCINRIVVPPKYWKVAKEEEKTRAGAAGEKGGGGGGDLAYALRLQRL